MENNLGLIWVFYGRGKGKTTAAIGAGIRAFGRGFKVKLIQFLKAGNSNGRDFNDYGELVTLHSKSVFSIERFGTPDWVLKKPTKKQLKAAQKALKAAERDICSGKYDLVIIDECLYAIQLKLITAKQLLRILKKKTPTTEVILTGGHKRIPSIEKVASIVTEMRKIKHPDQKGMPARIGIEY